MICVGSQNSNLANYSIGSVIDAGWGLNQVYLVLKKCGKVVDFNFVVSRPNGQDMIPSQYSFGTLTDGFQPAAIHYVLGSLYKTGDPNARKLCTVEIRPDCSLHIGYGISTAGYDGVTFSCSYLIG